MLAHALRSSYAVPLLQDIRRNVAASKITSTEAIHRAEIAVGGMQISDALRDDVIRILTLHDRLDDQTKNALMSLDSIQDSIPQHNDDVEVIRNKQNTITSLTAGYKFFLDNRKKLFDQTGDEGKKFLKKAQRLQSVPSAFETINEFVRILQARVAVTDKYFNRLVEREAEVDRKMKLGTMSEITATAKQASAEGAN